MFYDLYYNHGGLLSSVLKQQRETITDEDTLNSKRNTHIINENKNQFIRNKRE